MRHAIFLLLFMFAGCSSVSQRQQHSASIEVTPQPAIIVSEAAISTKAESQFYSTEPLPVYRSPKVVKVVVAPYINAKGEAFPESYKYVFADEGGWNIDALRNPERAYVPPENVEKPLNAPNVLWGSVAPGTPATLSPKGGDERSLRPLLNLSDVMITGFMNKDEEPRAREEAARRLNSADVVTVYDKDLGWLIVPTASLDSKPSTGKEP